MMYDLQTELLHQETLLKAVAFGSGSAGVSGNRGTSKRKIYPGSITVLKEGLLEVRESYSGYFRYVNPDNLMSLNPIAIEGRDCTMFIIRGEEKHSFWVDKPVSEVRLAIRQACGMSKEDAESELGLEALRNMDDE